jgi:hypothetical protein
MYISETVRLCYQAFRGFFFCWLKKFKKKILTKNVVQSFTVKVFFQNRIEGNLSSKFERSNKKCFQKYTVKACLILNLFWSIFKALPLKCFIQFLLRQYMEFNSWRQRKKTGRSMSLPKSKNGTYFLTIDVYIFMSMKKVEAKSWFLLGLKNNIFQGSICTTIDAKIGKLKTGVLKFLLFKLWKLQRRFFDMHIYVMVHVRGYWSPISLGALSTDMALRGARKKGENIFHSLAADFFIRYLGKLFLVMRPY